MSERDYLDSLIEERAAVDPEFAAAWERDSKRLELARLRKKLGLTQKDVAQIMGVKQPRVAEIEADPDKVAFGTISKYYKAIGAKVVIVEAAPAARKQTKKKVTA